jgi:hypothetical protein
LRDEVKKLRAMENHFYHFQQSLDHLEALLTASTVEERAKRPNATLGLFESACGGSKCGQGHYHE